MRRRSSPVAGASGPSIAALLFALLPLVGCRPPAPVRWEGPLDPVEARFDSLRFLRDQIDVTLARGVEATANGVSLAELRRAYQGVRAEFAELLQTLAADSLDPGDGRALAAMREVFRANLGLDDDGSGTVPAPGRSVGTGRQTSGPGPRVSTPSPRGPSPATVKPLVGLSSAAIPWIASRSSA